LSLNARIQGHKKVTGKHLLCKIEIGLSFFQLKNVYVNVSLMKERGLTEVEIGVFSSGID